MSNNRDSNNRDDEPFLSRWSRQKRDGRRPESNPPGADAAKKSAPEPEFDITKLPKLEDLTAETDITGFLQKGVPEALQKLALRRMWSLDPAIRDFVEVAENQWDFNVAGGVPGLFQELSDGTDVSLWMAQATPSMVVPPKAAPEHAPEHAPGHGAETAADELPAASTSTEVVAPEPGPLEADTGVAEPDVVADPPAVSPAISHNQAAGVPGQSTPARSRRRHGGALPVV
jgi:hypothetical protein